MTDSIHGAGAPPEGEHQELALARRLRESGVSESHLASAASYHRGVADRQPFSRTLVELGLASDEDVARWIAEPCRARWPATATRLRSTAGPTC
jgi:hypothetical protein